MWGFHRNGFRVLNDAPSTKTHTQATRERIIAAARKLDDAEFFCANFARQRTYTLGVIAHG